MLYAKSRAAAVTVKYVYIVLSAEMQCGLVETCRRFGLSYFLHLHEIGAF
jgi:hypothetical protein